MRAFSYFRARRRLSAVVIAALLVLGTIASLHHHRMVAPEHGRVIAATPVDDHPSRSVDCVVCRAAGPAGLAVARELAPPLVVNAGLELETRPAIRPSASLHVSPRAPPAQPV